MKRLTTILSLILLISCGQQENKTNQATTKKLENLTIDTNQTKITFYKINGKGILLGDNIKLLDENFKEIKDISYLNEQFVDITEVSDKYHKIKPTDDYCQEFKYVKIKTKDFEGYVDGRKIYKAIKHTQNKIVKIDNKEVSFIATTYFGIGVVKMVKNKYYENKYPYFELKEDDMAGDEILGIDKQADKYILSIRRVYQEGGANMKVAIYKNGNNKYVAEIIEYLSLEEEELQIQLKK
jgi:hypothetical protein